MNDSLITQFDAAPWGTGDVTMSTLANPAEWMFEAFGGWGRSDSGETVNPKTALGHGPVWQAINILAGDVGQLPLHVSRTRGRDTERADDHPIEWLLAHEPNGFQTPAVWKETMMSWCAGYGNACSWIIRDGVGRPSALLPLLPDRTCPIEVEYGEWWIETDMGDGKRFPIPYSDVFHIPWMVQDGFWGIGPIQACKNVIGTGLSLRKHGNSVFKNGANPTFALEHTGKQPLPDVMAQYRDELRKVHSGAGNSGNWLLLYGGTKATPLSMNNSDAQWLESLDLDREFIAGIFNVPIYRFSLKNSSTRANTEQQNTDYLNTSLGRHLNKFREEVRRKLFNYGERRLMRLDVDWTYEAFLRADLPARGAYYSQAKTGEWMTTNEIRKIEGLNPVKGGDEIRNPAINPASAPEPKPAEKKPAEETPEDRSHARRVASEHVRNQVGCLLDTEAKNVHRACCESSNLLTWADEYYSKFHSLAEQYLRLPCQLAAFAGLKADWWTAACEHACESQTRLLAMTGIATKDSLAQIGKDFAASVRGQKEQFANAILGE